MYFWNVKRLKTELQSSRLSEREGFKYVLASCIVLTILVEFALRFPEPVSSLESIASLGSFAVMCFGTYAAYAANGGATGVDFVARYLALGWVLSIRVFVLSTAVFILVGIVAAVADPVAAESDTFLDSASAVYTVTMMSVLYWRLVVHLRDLRADPPAIGVSARVSAS
jgi:hypothetical protein